MFAQPFAIPAGFFILFSLPLIFKLIPPNRVYGIRTPATRADYALWYRVNQRGGGAFLISGLFYLFLAWVYPSVIAGQTDFGRWVVHLVAFVGPLGVSLVLIRNSQSR